MKRAALAISLSAFTLAGCMGDDDSQTVNKESGSLSSGQVSGDAALSGDLMFAWPAHNESDIVSPVAASTPVFLQFSRPVTLSEDDLAQHLELVTDQGETIALTQVQRVNDHQGITAQPERTLEPGKDYTLSFGDANDGNEGAQMPDSGIRFRTAPATDGPIIGQTEGDGFRVARLIPVDSERYPATDLSTVRVQFTEPVKAESLIYGETFELLDGSGELVPAEIIASGHRLTIDPHEDLTPGETYELRVTDGITSQFTDAELDVPEDAPWAFTPMDATGSASSHSTIALEATMQSGSSELTGEALNSVNLESILLGPDNETITTGTTFARMGSIPSFEREGLSVPLSIDRNTLMEGTSLDIDVAGELPAGFSSEDVEVRFLSDATGFLMPNPYDPGGNKLLELYLDLGMTTENPIANASFAQQLLHVKLLGSVNVEDGRMVIEAVGVIEPEVLGIDQASGLISFRLEGFRDSADMPDPSNFVDTEAPFIRSWLPCNEQCGEEHDHQDKLRPGDDLTVHFSEPVLPSTVNTDSVVLENRDEGTSEPVSLTLNGSALTVSPEEPLEHGPDYQLRLSTDNDTITDLAGNELSPQDLAFSLVPAGERADDEEPQAPLPLTTLPGYPCAKTDVPGSLETEDHQGRCAGGRDDDETLPVMDHPSDRPLIVRFSENMDPSTLTADNLEVRKHPDGLRDEFEVVEDWTIEAGVRHLEIHPVAGWEEDTLYSYALYSDENDDPQQPSIRAESGLALHTLPLDQLIRVEDPERDTDREGSEEEESDRLRSSGGPNLVNYFRGAPKQEKALNPLTNVPAADSSADLRLQEVEKPEYPVDENDPEQFSAVRNSGRLDLTAEPDSDLVSDANIGCKVGEECPEDRFFHLTKKLDVEIAGDADEQGRVPVDVHPTVFHSTGLDVWVRVPIYDAEAESECDSLLECSWDGATSVVADTISEEDEHQLIATGPMIKRMRYAGDDGENPIPGHIFRNDEGQLSFETTLDLYLDAPYMDPRLPLTENMEHNLRSYPLEEVTVRGPINFHEDGRMEIRLANTEAIEIITEVEGNTLEGSGFGDFLVGSPDTTLELAIPEGEFVLNYVSPNPQK